MADTDILGAALTPMEQESLRAYDLLKQLAARDDLPPMRRPQCAQGARLSLAGDE